MSEIQLSSWIDAPLGELVSVIRGVTFPASSKVYKQSDDVVACLRTSHIQTRLLWDDIYFIPRHFVRRQEQLTQRNDILMSMANSSNLVGKVCINESDDAACFGAFLAAIRTREVDYKYIYYFLRSNAAQSTLRASSSQTVNIANISVGELEKLSVPLPPLGEQTRIAQKLDELLAQVDTLKARIDAIPALLERFRQSALASAVSGKLLRDGHEDQDVPNASVSWSKCKLTELSSLVTSGSRGWANYYADSGVVFIRSQDINTDELDLSKAAFVQLPESSEGKRTKVEQQDILITITGANVGKVARVKQPIEEAYVSQHVALVRLKNTQLAPFLELCLKDVGSGRGALTELAYGGGKPGLNLSNIRELVVSIPPKEEGTEIVRRVEQLFAFADQFEAKVAVAKQRIDTLTQSILAKAFRGELVPQDPDDEPASVLLERIRAQRAAAPKAKRGRKPAASG